MHMHAAEALQAAAMGAAATAIGSSCREHAHGAAPPPCCNSCCCLPACAQERPADSAAAAAPGEASTSSALQGHIAVGSACRYCHPPLVHTPTDIHGSAWSSNGPCLCNRLPLFRLPLTTLPNRFRFDDGCWYLGQVVALIGTGQAQVAFATPTR